MINIFLVFVGVLILPILVWILVHSTLILSDAIHKERDRAFNTLLALSGYFVFGLLCFNIYNHLAN